LASVVHCTSQVQRQRNDYQHQASQQSVAAARRPGRNLFWPRLLVDIIQ